MNIKIDYCNEQQGFFIRIVEDEKNFRKGFISLIPKYTDVWLTEVEAKVDFFNGNFRVYDKSPYGEQL